MGRHLAAAGGGIGRCSDALQKHRFRCDAEGEGERAVAVVEMEPIVAGVEGEAGGALNSFMACTADLEEDPVLALEHHLTVVQAPGGLHEPEGALQGSPVQPAVLAQILTR